MAHASVSAARHVFGGNPLAPALARALVFAFSCTLALASTGARAADFVGRGTFAFATASDCPLAVAATPLPCNRIALDDADTRATLDSDAHVIRFVNDRSYPRSTIVGDVLLQASGRAANGKRVPLNYHIVLSKSGNAWSVNSHAHAPVRGEFSDIRIEPYRIDVGGSSTPPRTLETPEAITRALAHPALAARMASWLVQVVDNRPAKSADSDLTINLGFGKAVLPVMRASLHVDPQASGAGGSVLDDGTWQLRLQALSGKTPEHVAQRELFLFGMDGEALLKPLVERGFAKGEELTVGAVAGKGYLRYAGNEQPFPAAATTARHFMQQSFIGLVLGWQQGAELGAR